MSPRNPEDIRQVPTDVGPIWIDRWDQGLGKTLSRRAQYEPDFTAWARRVLRSGMAVVDIGANIGYYTVLFARQVAPGRVLAFEPDPFNRELLERNLRDNGVQAQLSDAAVTDDSGAIRFYLDRNFRGLHSLSRQNRRSDLDDDYIDVPAVTLDEALAQAGWSGADLIKIDAQGAEGRILRGAAGTLGVDRPVFIMLELWPRGLANCGSSVDEVIRILDGWRFQPARVKQGELLPLGWGDVERRAARLDGDQASLNIVCTK